MKAVFDNSAERYDVEFTHSPIGQLQRQHVWRYLEQHLQLQGMDVLELNCGTGEDALFFARHDCKVLATDISRKMLMQTQRKATENNLHQRISTLWLDLNEIELLGSGKRFDLIFSNFGGLNCINTEQLKKALYASESLLRHNGRLVLVLMPKFCVWEVMYFFSKLKFKKAFRRSSAKAVEARVGHDQLKIWYYNRRIFQQLSDSFRIVHTKPIGFAVPPSYCNNTWLANKNILKQLDQAERKLNRFSFLSNYADHYLIDLELK